MKNNWKNYHQNTQGRSPAPLLKDALLYVTKKKRALDLGSGALVESKLLLSEGFQEVTAIDIVPFADLDDPRFRFVKSSFENFKFPCNTYDLVNANLALPFCKPDAFDKVWNKMRDSLVTGGIFSGQLFGVHDAWNIEDTEMTFHTKEDVDNLLTGFNIKKLEEIRKEGPLATGETKNWHLFLIIAEKA